MNKEIVLVIGAGDIGIAIARRQGFGRQILLADSNQKLLAADEIAIGAAYLLRADAGFITGSDLLIDGGVIASMLAGQAETPSIAA